MRNDTSKLFKVKLLGASESFNFLDGEFEQVLVHNTGTSAVLLRDNDNNDFEIASGVSFNLSTIPVKAISGLTIVTQASGSCQIAYVG